MLTKLLSVYFRFQTLAFLSTSQMKSMVKIQILNLNRMMKEFHLFGNLNNISFLSLLSKAQITYQTDIRCIPTFFF